MAAEIDEIFSIPLLISDAAKQASLRLHLRPYVRFAPRRPQAIHLAPYPGQQ